MKITKKALWLGLSLGLILSSCKDSNNKEKENANVGGGGTFNIAFEVAPKTVNPRSIIDFYSGTTANQIYEGLVKFNPITLKPEKAIAADYEVSTDLKTFSFVLREDVKFHDHEMFEGGKGRFVNSEDVKASFEYYCNPKVKGDPIAYLSVFKGTVLGADEFFKGEATSISGLKIDGKKVSIELVNSDVNFINKLCMIGASILPKEAIEKNLVNDGVGSGPFKLVKMTEEEVLFVKNQNYYGKNDKGEQLPILDSLVISVDDDKENQLAEFRDNKLNILIGLPPNKIVEVLNQNIEDFNSDPPKYISAGIPELTSSYISFNINRDVFKNAKVRKALSMAIDREVIIRDDLKSQAYNADGIYGITPPLSVIKDYDFNGIKDKAYGFDPEGAKAMLAEAGYPNGKGFPSIRLEYVESPKNTRVANSIMRHLQKYLNVNIQIESVSFEQKVENEKLGRGDMYLDAWIADYASPQTFLSNYLGKIIPEDPTQPSPINFSRYNNEEFDTHFLGACSTLDEKERNKKFAQAEKILVNDAAMIVLWYGEDQTIVHSNVRSLKMNPLKLLDFTNVYFKERVKGEKKKK